MTINLVPPNSGYIFNSWSGTNADDAVNTGGAYTIVMNGDKSSTANFNLVIYPLEILSEWSESHRVEISGITLSIAVDPANSGQVLTTPQQADYNFGSSVEVFAVANENYQFSNWNNEPTDTSKVKTVLLFSNLDLNAHFTSLTGLPDEAIETDHDYRLLQNYPNPFNPETIIIYRIPETSRVSLRIYNALGREITTLVNSLQTAGNHHLRWNARDNLGQKIHSGIYLCRLQVNGENNNYIKYIKMLLLQ